jgi:hypothetical protein
MTGLEHVARTVDRRGAYRFFGGDLRERDHLEDQGVDGKTILKCILKTCWNDVDSIELAQDTGKWWAVVNAVMNLRVP